MDCAFPYVHTYARLVIQKVLIPGDQLYSQVISILSRRSAAYELLLEKLKGKLFGTIVHETISPPERRTQRDAFARKGVWLCTVKIAIAKKKCSVVQAPRQPKQLGSISQETPFCDITAQEGIRR